MLLTLQRVFCSRRPILRGRGRTGMIRFSINLKNGPANDQVKIYVDGVLKKTGTTWEDYYRYDSEQAPQGNKVPTIDRAMYRKNPFAVTTIVIK